jgi:hypothetical protein
MAIEYPNQSRQEYGPVDSVTGIMGSVRVAGVKKQLVVPIVFNNLPDPAAEVDGDAVYQSIPANSLITACYGVITTNFNSTSGTTVIDVGTELADGTDVDLDGLINDWGGAADGSNTGWTVGAGALVGAVSHATLATYLKVTPSVDDLTAGAGKLIIEYIEVGV